MLKPGAKTGVQTAPAVKDSDVSSIKLGLPPENPRKGPDACCKSARAIPYCREIGRAVGNARARAEPQKLLAGKDRPAQRTSLACGWNNSLMFGARIALEKDPRSVKDSTRVQDSVARDVVVSPTVE